MAKVIIRHKWHHYNNLGLCSYPYTIRLKHNGSIVWSKVISSLPSPAYETHETTLTVKDGDLIRMDSNRNAYCAKVGSPLTISNCDYIKPLINWELVKGDPVGRNISPVSSFGSQYIEVRLRLVKADAPTYLETLDKLDQWSSAQYIPNSGNRLNL